MIVGSQFSSLVLIVEPQARLRLTAEDAEDAEMVSIQILCPYLILCALGGLKNPILLSRDIDAANC